MRASVRPDGAQNAYRQYMDQVRPSPKLLERTRARLRAEAFRASPMPLKKNARISTKALMATAAALILCAALLFTWPILRSLFASRERDFKTQEAEEALVDEALMAKAKQPARQEPLVQNRVEDAFPEDEAVEQAALAPRAAALPEETPRAAMGMAQEATSKEVPTVPSMPAPTDGTAPETQELVVVRPGGEQDQQMGIALPPQDWLTRHADYLRSEAKASPIVLRMVDPSLEALDHDQRFAQMIQGVLTAPMQDLPAGGASIQVDVLRLEEDKTVTPGFRLAQLEIRYPDGRVESALLRFEESPAGLWEIQR